MFENGSYLRRRKRFKLLKDQIKLNEDEQRKSSINKKPITKTSFFIENLLANDTNTNTSSSTNSSSSETNSTFQQLHFTNDLDFIRKITLFNEHHQPFYW